MKRLGTLLGAVLGLALLNAGAACAEVVAYFPGMLLGTGYDTLTGMTKTSCVNYTTTQSPKAALSQVAWDLSEITSSSDLLTITSVDASASVSYGLFSANAEMGLLSKSHVANYNSNFLAHVSVEKSWDYATEYAVKANYGEALDQDPELFRQQCGNRFVAGVLMGGQFYGMMMVSTSSQEDKNEVSGSLRASYGLFAEASGSFTKEAIQKLQSHSLTITGYATGSSAAGVPMTFEELRARVKNFPSEVEQSGGAPIRVLLAEYPAYSRPANPLIFQMAQARWDYVSVKNEIQYVLDHADQFYMDQATWRPFLERTRATAENAVTSFGDALQACGQSPSVCVRPQGLPSPAELRSKLPPRYRAVCGEVTLDLSKTFSMEIHPLGRKTKGDGEMDGHNPKTTLESSLSLATNGRMINVKTKVKMEEDRKDWTTFEDSRTTSYPLSIPSGCYVKNAAALSPNTGSILGYGGMNNHSWTTYGGGMELLASAKCLSDTSGNDYGKTGCKNIRFRDVTAKLSHEEDRMGPNTLAASSTAAWRGEEEARKAIAAKVKKKEAEDLALFRLQVPQKDLDLGIPVLQRLPASVPLEHKFKVGDKMKLLPRP